MTSSYVTDYGPTTGIRAYAFMTRKDGHARTIGTIFFLPPASIDQFEWNEIEAQSLSRMFERSPNAVTPAARGKVVFIRAHVDGSHEVSCYQVKGRSATRTICGNAAAASAVAIAEETEKKAVEFTLKTDGAKIEVAASVSRDGQSVAQEWRINSDSDCVELAIANHKTIACNFLNPYILMEGTLAVRPAELLASAGYSTDVGLNQKYAIIDSTRAIPYIRFFGCNGAHGAAPLSGIVTLALAARRVEWIKAALETGLFEHPMGVEVLPAITMAGKVHSVVMLPEIQACTYAIAVI